MAFHASDLALLHKGNMIGDIKVDMRYFAVSKPVKHEDGTVDPAPESSTWKFLYMSML